MVRPGKVDLGQLKITGHTFTLIEGDDGTMALIKGDGGVLALDEHPSFAVSHCGPDETSHCRHDADPGEHATFAVSHCGPDETTYFNCTVRLSSKVISVCGSRQEGKESYLQYRFGRIGNIELEFPKKRPGSVGKFYWKSQKESYGVFSNLSFRNYSYYYDVSYNINFDHRYGDDDAFVEVSKSKSQYRPSLSVFNCAEFPEGKFGDLAEIVKNK